MPPKSKPRFQKPSPSISETKVLILDDEISSLQVYSFLLEKLGYEPISCTNLEEAIDQFNKLRPDAVVTDFKLKEGTSLPLIRHIHNEAPETPIVVVSGFVTEIDADQLSNSGANEILSKSQPIDQIIDKLQGIIPDKNNTSESTNGHQRAAEQSNGRLPRALLSHIDWKGRSDHWGQSRDSLRRLSAERCPVLFQAPKGSEVDVLINSLEKDQLAEGGSILEYHAKDVTASTLSEIEDVVFQPTATKLVVHFAVLEQLSLDLQRSLSDFLILLGRTRWRQNLPRFIFSIQDDIDELVSEEQLDSRLTRLIGRERITLPSLDERREDVPFLADAICVAELGKDVADGKERLTQEAQQALMSYSWPGNFDELVSTVQHVCSTHDDLPIGASTIRSCMKTSDRKPIEVGSIYNTISVSVVTSCLDEIRRRLNENSVKSPGGQATTSIDLSKYVSI
ncbi:MAG: response regulator [Verrucomicrobiota bacterium]